MTKNYRKELQNLGKTFEIANHANVGSLTYIIERCLDKPLMAIGSGGSYSTASVAALLHEHYTGQIARATTPLEYIAAPGTKASVLCFTASGRNRDIALAFKLAAVREGGLVGALVMAGNTPIHALQARFKYTHIVEYQSKNFVDGFLAVASLVASTTLLARAYETVLGIQPTIPNSLDRLVWDGTRRENFNEVIGESDAVIGRQIISVLYTPSAKPAAIDLESRFVEAALMPLHIADLRNFGHGRHHWIAKRGHETGVISLIGDSLATLADRTISLLPSEVAHKRIDLFGSIPVQAITALIAGIHLAEIAGKFAGVDPAKPGVPEFGRKLYRLGPGTHNQNQRDLNQHAAIRRKTSAIEPISSIRGDAWHSDYLRAITRFKEMPIGGVVFDYDGTLCASKNRTEPPAKEIGIGLCKLLKAGIAVGIATGRGPSAGKALRNLIPSEFWDELYLGYYNGNIVLPLGDKRDPIAKKPGPRSILDALLRDPIFSTADLRSNSMQVSIRLEPATSLSPAMNAARRIVGASHLAADVIASDHSIDIVLGDASKTSLVDFVASKSRGPEPNVVRIGDKGAWPGNDYELLDHPLGLSVDQVSPNPDNCWNLAPAGILGVQATLYYISRFHFSKNGVFLRINPRDRGY